MKRPVDSVTWKRMWADFEREMRRGDDSLDTAAVAVVADDILATLVARDHAGGTGKPRFASPSAVRKWNEICRRYGAERFVLPEPEGVR